MFSKVCQQVNFFASVCHLPFVTKKQSMGRRRQSYYWTECGCIQRIYEELRDLEMFWYVKGAPCQQQASSSENNLISYRCLYSTQAHLVLAAAEVFLRGHWPQQLFTSFLIWTRPAEWRSTRFQLAAALSLMIRHAEKMRCWWHGLW